MKMLDDGAVAICLLCIIFKLTEVSPMHSLKRHNITNYMQLGAICNDGSPAIYYLNKVNNNQKWLIFIEGGGSCTSPDGDCIKRSKATPYYTSSNYHPDYIIPKTLMADRTFAGYNKALLVQCSSDVWLGNSSDNTQTKTESHRKQSTQFAFRGAVIFQSVMQELMEKGMNMASEVYLVGRSAGGIGIANHLQNLQNMLPSATKLYVSLDSSWFLNYDNFLNRSSLDILNDSGVRKLDSCRDESWGFPCCLSVPCMVSRSYIPQNIPILLLISKYDIYPLFNRLIFHNTSFGSILTREDIMLTVHSYGGRMEQTLQILNSKPNIAYALTSCFHHGYLVSSNLWNLLYNPKLILTFPSVSFRHVVNESLWNDVKIGRDSIQDIILDWKENFAGIVNKSDGRQLYHRRDECLSSNCNPTCPVVATFDDFSSKDDLWEKIVFTSIVVFITVCCLITKCYWVLQHRHFQKCQAAYLKQKYGDDGDMYVEDMSLPTCPPQEPIGISCSNLRINNTTKTGALFNKHLNIKYHKEDSLKASSEKTFKGITAYFNPGQLVAIMGPSESGKTTLLDMLTVRNLDAKVERNVFFNGLPAEETKEWFIKNSGYILQLATPYHEELTVRQNLTYSAMMRLPMKMKIQDKMWRVEQVVGQCGLYDVADVVVGDSSPTGGGLSGGQKRRLCIALQLLELPSVIFLDEPITGLDTTSSLELLETLHRLTLSGRLVVLTVHEPRIEILHMFDAILFLCDGKVGYFGSPIMAPNMFVEALEGSEKPFDASNPADSIMDVLTNPTSQENILDYYLQSGEIQAINRAIERAKRYPQKTLSMKFDKETSSIHNRLLVLDGRSSSAETVSQMLYLPVVFSLYVLALATSYYQTPDGIFLMSCYMVFSCASQLFMGSVIHAHLNKEFALFALERADGVGHSTELVLHVFIRTFSKSFLPLFCSCVIIYLCTVREYVLWKFCLTTMIHLQLNQAWIAIIIFTACSIPRYSSLVTPILSACAGFSGGFLIPQSHMPDIFYWMFYINPTHWAYSAMMKVLIHDVKFDCQWDPSPLECLETIGILILEKFGFSDRNPYASMLVLLMMLMIFLILSVVMLEIKHCKRKWKSLWKDFKTFFSSSVTVQEKEGRKSDFKVEEARYKHNNEGYCSAYENEGYLNNSKEKDISFEFAKNKMKEMQDMTQWCNVDQVSEATCSSSNSMDDVLDSISNVVINISGEQDDCSSNSRDENDDNKESLSRAESFQTITTCLSTPSQISPKGTLPKNEAKGEKSTEDTWSKYLDQSPLCHEVHSASNSIMDIRSRRNRRGVKRDLNKQGYIHIEEEKSQSFILSQKKCNLRSQLNSLCRQNNDTKEEGTQVRRNSTITKGSNETFIKRTMFRKTIQ